MLKHIDNLAADWAHAIQTIMERSCLSYPNASSIARINEGGSQVACSKCPEMFTTGRITAFHNIYKDLPSNHQKIIHKRYIKSIQLNSREYHILDSIHKDIDKSLKTEKDRLKKDKETTANWGKNVLNYA